MLNNGQNIFATGGAADAFFVNSNLGAFSAGEKVCFLTLDVTIPGAATVKVWGRAQGSGQAGARINTATTGFTATLAFVNATSGATTAGGTGITATGLYIFDVTGMEFGLELDWTSGAAVVAYGTLATPGR